MTAYGELDDVPLDVDIKSRMLTYLTRLCLGDKHKISNTIFIHYFIPFIEETKIYSGLNGCKL